MAAYGISSATDDTNTNIAVKVPERVLRRDQARLEEVERRKNVKESLAVTEEKSDFFTATFSAEKAAVEDLLTSCNHGDRVQATRTLEDVTVKIQQLQKFLNDSVMFLTQYEIKQAQASLQKLLSSLAEKREEALPKKRFTFRSRMAGEGKQPAPKPEAPASAVAMDAVAMDAVAMDAVAMDAVAMDAVDMDAVAKDNVAMDAVAKDAVSKDAVAMDTVAKDAVAMDAAISVNQCGFSNVDGQVLIMHAEVVQQRDVLLSNLTNCKVRIYGCPSTLHIKVVRNCEILCGPVSSSVFIDQCKDSTLGLSCQQLRTHNTSATEIYLHVTSRAIVEDCHGVRFAPLTWTYPGVQEHFKMSGLNQERNNWKLVDDFNWLAAGVPSPNWTVIPESERISSWESVPPAI